MMVRKYGKSLVAVMTVGCLIRANLYVASSTEAHQAYENGQPLHWHKGGSAIHISITNYASYYDAAEQAISNHYFTIPSLYWDRVTPSEVYVFSGDYGQDGKCGNTILSFDPGSGHLSHADSKYNDNPSQSCGQTDPTFIRGIFCHEIGHAWGQDHHTLDNSCMGLTYGGSGTNLSSHDKDDFVAWYQCHLGC